MGPLSQKRLSALLKNEYFIVCESNMKEGPHINKTPLICISSGNGIEKEIFASLIVHLVYRVCDLFLVLGKKALAFLWKLVQALWFLLSMHEGTTFLFN